MIRLGEEGNRLMRPAQQKLSHQLIELMALLSKGDLSPTKQKLLFLEFRLAIDPTVARILVEPLNVFQRILDGRIEEENSAVAEKKAKRTAINRSNAKRPRPNRRSGKSTVLPSGKVISITGRVVYPFPCITLNRKGAFVCETCNVAIAENAPALFWSKQDRGHNYCANHIWDAEVEKALSKSRHWGAFDEFRQTSMKIRNG